MKKIHHKHTSEKLKHSTVTVNVDDRFAKIATVYTGGAVKVRYLADQICTDNVEVITLPEVIHRCGDDLIAKAWGYLNHEMGHIEVQRQLQQAKDADLHTRIGRRFGVTKSSREIYESIPEAARHLGIEPGSPALTPVDLLVGLRDVGRKLCDIYTISASAAASMLKTLINVTEDPRMERQVAKRWAGAAEHLRDLNAVSHVEWKNRSEELLEEGTDGSFFQFGCGIIFYLEGQDVSFMGPRVMFMIAAVQDILDTYRKHWDTETAHGFYDAYNCALALLVRVQETMLGISEPDPEEVEAFHSMPMPEPEPESEEVDPFAMPEEDEDEDEGKGGGEGSEESEGEGDDDADEDGGADADDSDTEPSGEDGGGEGGEGDAESDGEGEDEDGEEGDGDGESNESDSEGSEGEGAGEESSDDGEGSSEGGGDSEGDSGEDSKGGDDGSGGSDGGSDSSEDGGTESAGGKLSVGNKVRVKSTGEVARVTKVYEDGSVEVEVA